MILVDTSGSMKGLRIAIAKHTITTILDTLGENDFVNIITVSVRPGGRQLSPVQGGDAGEHSSACTKWSTLNIRVT